MAWRRGWVRKTSHLGSTGGGRRVGRRELRRRGRASLKSAQRVRGRGGRGRRVLVRWRTAGRSACSKPSPEFEGLRGLRRGGLRWRADSRGGRELSNFRAEAVGVTECVEGKLV